MGKSNLLSGLESTENRMTLKEVAETTGAAYRTVAAYAQKAGWTKDGKQTLLTEEQSTMILEAMKIGSNNQHDLASSLQGVETSQSRALRIDLLHKQIEAEMEAEMAELKAQNLLMKPKADYYDTLVDRKGLTNFRDTAKELRMPEKQFIDFLIEKHYVYRDGDGHIKPYSDKMKFFAMKDFEANGKVRNQTLITVEGKKHFMNFAKGKVR